jgi:hypothetical protein
MVFRLLCGLHGLRHIQHSVNKLFVTDYCMHLFLPRIHELARHVGIWISHCLNPQIMLEI